MTLPGTSAVPSALPVADLDRRFHAFLLDRVLAWGSYVVAAAVGWALWGRDGLWLTAVLVLLLAVAVTVGSGIVVGATGATAGKRLVGLRVVDEGTGSAVGARHGVLRALLLGLSALPTVGLGLATLAWTALVDPLGQRRGWHDRWARSVVVDVRPAPLVPQAETVEPPRQVVNLTALRLVPAPALPVPERTTPRTPTAAVAEGGRTVVRSAGRQPGGPVTPPGPAAPRWRVAFDTGEAFRVEGLALVGRHPEPRDGEVARHLVALPSADMSLSKTHAQLGPAPDGTLVVMDRGSTNGSLLLRRGVVRELGAGRPATLVAGDRVRFGDREMSVERDS